MREKVKHYQGNEITSEVIRKMNLIEMYNVTLFPLLYI